MKELGKRLVCGLARRSQFVRNVATFIVDSTAPQKNKGAVAKDTYGYLKERFINNGQAARVDRSMRCQIVERFEAIDREVPIGTTPTDGLFLAELLLNVETEGAIVECGCYAGGSSAKLSILAKLLDRRLVVFDSFEGLPPVKEYYLRDKHCRRGESWVSDWTAGRYAARLDEVQNNITRYGEISSCSFVKGWFSKTLIDENLPRQVALAFADVDLADSARDCFVALWPRISEKGVFVTHDTAYIKVLQEFYSPGLWRERFKSLPPILFGAGFGLCNESPHIGYMVKGEGVSAEYLKSLTIDK